MPGIPSPAATEITLPGSKQPFRFCSDCKKRTFGFGHLSCPPLW